MGMSLGKNTSAPSIQSIRSIYRDDYWTSVAAQVDEIDELIGEFNERVGLLKG